MKRNKILALIGAAVLTLGVAGVALAEELNDGQVGNTLGSFDNDCSDFPLEVGAGEIGVHFVLTDPDGGATSAILQATFSNPAGSIVDLANTPKNSTTLHFYAVITGDADTVIESASTDVDGGNLNVSHVCAGEETTTTTTTTTTSFSSSEESTTDTESTTTSFSSSEESTTNTQPQTDTIGNTGSGQQSGGLWMLLAALGVLAGSVIVLAPSKAKSKD
jgi:hypothetical protein